MSSLPTFLIPRDLPPLEEVEPSPMKDDLAVMLDELEAEVQDPLKPIAQRLRALSAEHLWKMCDHMGKPELPKTLVNWAISYLDETPMPKEERRV